MVKLTGSETHHHRIGVMSALVEGQNNEGRRAVSQAIVLLCLSGFKRTTMLEAKAPL
jgi:hypothetical protein